MNLESAAASLSGVAKLAQSRILAKLGCNRPCWRHSISQHKKRPEWLSRHAVLQTVLKKVGTCFDLADYDSPSACAGGVSVHFAALFHSFPRDTLSIAGDEFTPLELVGFKRVLTHILVVIIPIGNPDPHPTHTQTENPRVSGVQRVPWAKCVCVCVFL